jgi:hypothetical protein
VAKKQVIYFKNERGGDQLGAFTCGFCKYADDKIGESNARCHRCLMGKKPSFTLDPKWAKITSTGEEEQNEENYNERMAE